MENPATFKRGEPVLAALYPENHPSCVHSLTVTFKTLAHPLAIVGELGHN
jgi:hypothetical protein